MGRKIKTVKKSYLSEFAKRQAILIKSRVRFLCILAVFIYFLATVMSFVMIPRELYHEEISMWQFLILSSLLIFLLIGRVRTIRFAKIYAYLYTVALLYVLTKVHIIYSYSIPFSSTAYIFLFFLVSFTIPWAPKELILLSFTHIFAYNFLYMYTHQHMPEQVKAAFGVIHYFSGFIFLCMGFVLSYVVRRKEAARELENFILLKEAEVRSSQMQKELNLATRIHATLIPSSASTELFDIDVAYLPVGYMGGDYARYYFLDNDLLMFIICDVTGHGVSAALLVNRLHMEFERLVKKDSEPGGLLKELNDFIIKEFEVSNMYLSAFCGLADLHEMKLVYSNNGHPNQYMYKTNESRLISMPAQKTLLGIAVEKDKVLQDKVVLDYGDRIVLFTDGLTEIKNRNGEEYAKEQLESFISDNASLNAKSFNAQLLREIKSFKWGAFRDDIFLMNILVKTTGHAKRQ